MKADEGDLTTAGIVAVLEDVAAERQTGRLEVRRNGARGEQVAEVYFREGDITHAALVGSNVRLGTRLVSAGLLSRAEVEGALARRREGDERKLGDILIDAGLVDRAQVERIVHKQIEDTVVEILPWRQGRFRFEARREAERGAGIQLGVEALLTEAGRRMEEWWQMRSVVPSVECVPRFDEAVREPPEVTLTPEEWSLLARCDGETTLSEIAATCGFTTLEAVRTLHSLVAGGVVEVASAGAALAEDEVRGDHSVFRAIPEPGIDGSEGFREQVQPAEPAAAEPEPVHGWANPSQPEPAEAESVALADVAQSDSAGPEPVHTWVELSERWAAEPHPQPEQTWGEPARERTWGEPAQREAADPELDPTWAELSEPESPQAESEPPWAQPSEPDPAYPEHGARAPISESDMTQIEDEAAPDGQPLVTKAGEGGAEDADGDGASPDDTPLSQVAEGAWATSPDDEPATEGSVTDDLAEPAIPASELGIVPEVPVVTAEELSPASEEPSIDDAAPGLATDFVPEQGAAWETVADASDDALVEGIDLFGDLAPDDEETPSDSDESEDEGDDDLRWLLEGELTSASRGELPSRAEGAPPAGDGLDDEPSAMDDDELDAVEALEREVLESEVAALEREALEAGADSDAPEPTVEEQRPEVPENPEEGSGSKEKVASSGRGRKRTTREARPGPRSASRRTAGTGKSIDPPAIPDEPPSIEERDATVTGPEPGPVDEDEAAPAAPPAQESSLETAVSSAIAAEEPVVRIEESPVEEGTSEDFTWDFGSSGEAAAPPQPESAPPRYAPTMWDAPADNDGEELGPRPSQEERMESGPPAPGRPPLDDPNGRDVWDEAMSGSGDEAMEYRSVARHFAEFSGMAKIVAAAPDPKEAPPGVELMPRPRRWEGGRRAPVDPEVDTSALIREFSGFGTEGKADRKKDDPPAPSPPPPARAPSPPPPVKKPPEKGRGFLGRKRR
ncbi:MAG: DUF4388 domain-containing protein [Actinomycetota bacterium]